MGGWEFKVENGELKILYFANHKSKISILKSKEFKEKSHKVVLSKLHNLFPGSIQSSHPGRVRDFKTDWNLQTRTGIPIRYG